jgi:hypothetical protein
MPCPIGIREYSSGSLLFFSAELGVPISPCDGRLKIKELLTKKYSSYWAAMPVIGQSWLFIEGPLEKLSRT